MSGYPPCDSYTTYRRGDGSWNTLPATNSSQFIIRQPTASAPATTSAPSTTSAATTTSGGSSTSGYYTSGPPRTSMGSYDGAGSAGMYSTAGGPQPGWQPNF